MALSSVCLRFTSMRTGVEPQRPHKRQVSQSVVVTTLPKAETQKYYFNLYYNPGLPGQSA